MSSQIRTKVVIVSDTHGIDFSLRVRSADVVIHCGDLTRHSRIEEYRKTINCLKQIDAPLKLAIAGNHDLFLDKVAFEKKVSEQYPPIEPELVAKEHSRISETFEEAGIILLHEGNHQFSLANGALLTIYASPYTPSYGGNAFQYRPENGHDFSIATGTDIVVTHGPPKGMMDFTRGRERAGCPELFAAIARAKPQVHCFGHIHEGWGARRVTWRETYGFVPTHLIAIDNEKSMLIEKLSTLEPSRFDSHEELVMKQKRLAKYREDGFIEVDQTCLASEQEQSSQTLFVNAAMENEGELSQLPWVVYINLPADTSNNKARR